MLVNHQFSHGRLRVAALVLLAVISLFGVTERSRADVPSPIDPTSGQQNLLDLVKSLPINNIQSALDNYPVPYVVCASAGTATQTCVNQKSGSPQRLDADKNKATGKGGDDIQVEVNTELLPTPHLRVNIIQPPIRPLHQRIRRRDAADERAQVFPVGIVTLHLPALVHEH